MKRKFCWIPTEVYSGPFMRDGFVWLGFAYKCGRRHYRNKPEKIKIRFKSDGEVSVVVRPCWSHDAPYNQLFEILMLKYKKPRIHGLGNIGSYGFR